MANRTGAPSACYRFAPYCPRQISFRLAAGADAATVSGLGLPSTPAQVLVTVRKVSGGMNLFATVRDDSITTAGFTVDLSAATDAGTYKLDYLVIL
jgi:hypothetical protein